MWVLGVLTPIRPNLKPFTMSKYTCYPTKEVVSVQTTQGRVVTKVGIGMRGGQIMIESGRIVTPLVKKEI